MKLKGITLLFALLFLQQITKAQDHPIISYFTGDVYNDQILLSWNIVDGNNCNGINILRSADDSIYTVIGNIPGICGAVSDLEKYSFLDENPLKNQINYYKLQLGGQGYTTALSIAFYETNEKGFIVFPNPSNDIFYLFISDVYTESEVEIIDVNGRQVYNEKVNSGSLIEINPVSIRSGTYILRLKNGDDVVGSDRIIRL